MGETPTKKLKLNRGPMEIETSRFRAIIKLQALGRQNVTFLKQKLAETFHCEQLV